MKEPVLNSKTGLYELTAYRSIPGREHNDRKKFTGKTKKEVTKAAIAWHDAPDTDKTMTAVFGVVFKTYIDEMYKSPYIKGNTYRNTISVYNNGLKRFFGSRLLKDIKKSDIKAYYEYLMAGGKNGKIRKEGTVNECLQRLKTFLNWAVENEYITGYEWYSPHGKIRRTSGLEENGNTLSKSAKIGGNFMKYEEFELFLECAKEICDECHDAVEILFKTGMRKSELMALKYSSLKKVHDKSADVPDCIDCEINQAVKKGKYIKDQHNKKDKTNIYEYGLTKTGKNRTIPFPPSIMERLEKKRKKNGLSMEDRIFGREYMVKFDKDFGKAKRLACSRYPDVESFNVITIHGMRHSYVHYMLFDRHILIQDISRVLGHSSIEITYKVYSEFLQADNGNMRVFA